MQPRKIGPDVGFRQPGQVGNEAAVTISSRVGSRSSTFTVSPHASSKAFRAGSLCGPVAMDVDHQAAAYIFARSE